MGAGMAKKKILWVDDDEDIILSLQPRLEKEGWEVQTALSAEQAKPMAVNDRPDLIIMDIIMEGEHGYSAIEDFKG
jgi:DNA-binding NtrC family response regulator